MDVQTDWTDGLTGLDGLTALDKLWRMRMAWPWRTLFGVPSDILIWPHFHSQATVPFVLAGVCWTCVNLLISDGVDRGIQLTFKGGRGYDI